MDWGQEKQRKRRKKKKEKADIYVRTKSVLQTDSIASRSSKEDFLPRTDFHRWSGRPIEKENLWITRGPRAEIEPRQSAARAPLVDPRVAINQIDPGHERNLFLSSSRDPRSSPFHSPSSFSLFTARSRAREINSRCVNYPNIDTPIYAVSFFFEWKAPSNRDIDCTIARIVAVSRKTVASTIASSAWRHDPSIVQQFTLV